MTSQPAVEIDTAFADDLVRRLVAFAEAPAEADMDGLFADLVVLDVYERLQPGPTRRPRETLGDARSWQLDEALNLLDLLEEIAKAGDYHVVVGRHRYCAGPPLDVPDGAPSLTPIAIVAAGEMTSCLQWYAVDIYVDRFGRIAYVQAQLWER